LTCPADDRIRESHARHSAQYMAGSRDMKDDKGIVRLRRRLLKWGRAHGQDFPWRRTQDPYALLVAEFMLHRTRADQVRAVFERFMADWPTLDRYVVGDAEAVKQVLWPLGLNWRIEGMMQALTLLHTEFGYVPVDKEALLSIPGIGPYIASAVVCFSQNQPVALVDTNTVRVTGRVYGLDLRGEARRRKEMINQIAAACDPERPRDYYHAMIDLAHMICRPKEPDCRICPLLNVPCSSGQEFIF
jgi:A/G-specific adenine glycosylase